MRKGGPGTDGGKRDHTHFYGGYTGLCQGLHVKRVRPHSNTRSSSAIVKDEETGAEFQTPLSWGRYYTEVPGSRKKSQWIDA